MGDFWLWFSTGTLHILDWGAYDHILFVTILSLSFPLKDWKKLVILITAFTLGHSLSLALSVSNVFNLPQRWVELFIALSILISAANQLTAYKKESQKVHFLYGITGFFGLIHGLGFSYLLKSMLGKEERISLPLLYFNLGLELGQLIIVAFVLGISLLLAFLNKWKFKHFKLFILCIIALIAVKISTERLLDLYHSF